MTNLKLNMEYMVNQSSFLVVVLGDVNATLQGWQQNDITTFEVYKIDITTFEVCKIDITIFEVYKIDITTCQFSLRQIIEEPTHILNTSASSVDLISTNLVIHFGVHPSIHPNSHHQVVFAKYSLSIFYAPPYNRLVWHYQQVITNHIKWAIELFGWEKAPSNLHIDKQVSAFNETIFFARNNHLQW